VHAAAGNLDDALEVVVQARALDIDGLLAVNAHTAKAELAGGALAEDENVQDLGGGLVDGLENAGLLRSRLLLGLRGSSLALLRGRLGLGGGFVVVGLSAVRDSDLLILLLLLFALITSALHPVDLGGLVLLVGFLRTLGTLLGGSGLLSSGRFLGSGLLGGGLLSSGSLLGGGLGFGLVGGGLLGSGFLGRGLLRLSLLSGLVLGSLLHTGGLLGRSVGLDALRSRGAIRRGGSSALGGHLANCW
jgi:hypothetical protein